MNIFKPPALTLGIEEEYLLVDKETRNLVTDPPDELMKKCEKRLEGQVSAELLRSQIEVGTRVCRNIDEAREDLAQLRSTVAEVAGEFNIAPIAASTHPFGTWTTQRHTPKERYDALLADMAGAARRMLICGMHVHAGVEDADLRVDLLNQLSYFLPHLLAYSTSSPFWRGEDMGMMSYRTIVFDALPRTGLPPRFASYSEYEGFVNHLVKTGTIEDATKIWWDARLSARFPTIEMRATDVCTRLEDCLAIAATYQSLLRMLYRLRCDNRSWRLYSLSLIRENRWRAMRYGADGKLIDFGTDALEGFDHLTDELLFILREDADALGCLPELEHLRTIVRRGTSAHRQLHVYQAARQDGADHEEALNAVVDHLITETLEGFGHCPLPGPGA